MALAFGCWGVLAHGVMAQNPTLEKLPEPFTVGVPVFGGTAASNTFTAGIVKLGWSFRPELGELEDAVTFKFAEPAGALMTLSSELWIASLNAALVWQQAWKGATWEIGALPDFDTTGNSAALAIGMIAAASHTSFPEKTAVLAGLNPDGSLGLVLELDKRVQAAAKAGMQRVVIPKIQSTDYSGSRPVKIAELATRLGLECLQAETLHEATQMVLGKTLPEQAEAADPPKYGAAVSSIFAERARQEQERTEADRRTWPRENNLPRTMSVVERQLWTQIFASYQVATDAAKAGQSYLAYDRFREINGMSRGVTAILAARRDFRFPETERKAEEVRQAMVRRMLRPSIDKDELQSGMVLAEEADWLYTQNARVEGAQIMARQAFSPRSDATPEQRQIAQDFLVSSMERSAYEMRDGTFFTTVYFAMGRRVPIPVYDRATIWLQQVVPAQLALAEFFNLGLRARANDLRESLIFDPRLASYTRVLRDTKKGWEQREQVRSRERRRLELAANPGATSGFTQNIGFVPGKAYGPPRAPVAPAIPKSLSDTASVLTWVNDFCEVAILDQKYIHLGGSFDEAKMEWTLRNKEALSAMLAHADLAAKRGIVMAVKAGVDATVLTMIYESGQSLRSQSDPLAQLNGLRQLWRCALLGNMGWQLGFGPPPPTATVEDAEGDSIPPAETAAGDGKEMPPPPETLVEEDDAPRAIAISPDTTVLTNEPEAPPMDDAPRAMAVEDPLETIPIYEEDTPVMDSVVDPNLPDTIPVRRALPVESEDAFAEPMIPETEILIEPTSIETPAPAATAVEPGSEEPAVPTAIPVN